MNREVILRHPFFQQFPKKLIKHICSAAHILVCAPGDIVLQEGHRADAMYFLVNGRLKVRPPRQLQLNGDGEASSAPSRASARLKPAFLEPPCWFGDTCLFKD